MAEAAVDCRMVRPRDCGHAGSATSMLTADQRALWDAYLAAESRDRRARKLAALDAFLGSLAYSPEANWFPWARSVAEGVVDRGGDLVIRMPLFERAVFPALLMGYRAGMPGCARWLAGLSQHLYRSDLCRDQLPPGERTEEGLLRAAVRHDPADRASYERLVRTLADRLRYTLHELPSGVLYGVDGATPDQCLELAADAEEFSALLGARARVPAYDELVRDCRFHYRAYHDFLLNRARYGSYAEYLAQLPSDRLP